MKHCMGDFLLATDRGRASDTSLSTNINVDMQVTETDGSAIIAAVDMAEK